MHARPNADAHRNQQSRINVFGQIRGFKAYYKKNPTQIGKEDDHAGSKIRIRQKKNVPYVGGI